MPAPLPMSAGCSRGCSYTPRYRTSNLTPIVRRRQPLDEACQLAALSLANSGWTFTPPSRRKDVSKSPEADELREALLRAIRSHGAQIEKLSDMAAKEEYDALNGLFQILGGSGREVYILGGVGLINIHVSTDRSAWWNVMKSVKASFEWWTKHVGQKCLFVFLTSRKDGLLTGYIASGFDADPFLQPPSEQQTKFMVKESKHLNPLKRIVSAQLIAEQLLSTN